MNSYIEQEYKDAYEAWKKAQNAEARANMSRLLLPVIKQTIYASGGDVNNPAMLAKGRMLAVQALRGYDPSKAKLNNYMYSHLMGLNRVIGTSNNIIQIPESVVLDKKKLATAEQELSEKLGRFPSSSELADYTKLSVSRISKLRSANLPMNESKLTSETGDSFNSKVQILGDTSRQDAWMEYVYDSCDDRKRAIMERLYGMHGLPQQNAKEVAKNLKITPAAVSQQRKKIDELIDSEKQYDLFGE